MNSFIFQRNKFFFFKEQETERIPFYKELAKHCFCLTIRLHIFTVGTWHWHRYLFIFIILLFCYICQIKYYYYCLIDQRDIFDSHLFVLYNIIYSNYLVFVCSLPPLRYRRCRLSFTTVSQCGSYKWHII